MLARIGKDVAVGLAQKVLMDQIKNPSKHGEQNKYQPPTEFKIQTNQNQNPTPLKDITNATMYHTSKHPRTAPSIGKENDENRMPISSSNLNMKSNRPIGHMNSTKKQHGLR